MVFKSIIGATYACLAVVSFNVNSALVGRLAATPGGTDYQAYYDTEADLTWLADVNVAGTMNWATANQWAADLVVGGNDNWRLASALNLDNTGPCGAYYNCTDSEMGSLFYTALGNTAGLLTNTGPFSNFQSGSYWLATEYAPITNYAWYFDMSNGTLDGYVKSTILLTWAVQSGDVSAVPIPAAAWLFGSGLIGLIGFARRKA